MKTQILAQKNREILRATLHITQGVMATVENLTQ